MTITKGVFEDCCCLACVTCLWLYSLGEKKPTKNKPGSISPLDISFDIHI